jgi:uncharacterized membrane protein
MQDFNSFIQSLLSNPSPQGGMMGGGIGGGGGVDGGGMDNGATM